MHRRRCCRFAGSLKKPIPLSKKRETTKKVASLFLVEVTGLEPAASCSQSKRATNCATPRYLITPARPFATLTTFSILLQSKRVSAEWRVQNDECFELNYYIKKIVVCQDYNTRIFIFCKINFLKFFIYVTKSRLILQKTYIIYS